MKKNYKYQGHNEHTSFFLFFFKVATVVNADISTGKRKEAGVKNRGSSDPQGIPQTSPPRSPAGATNSSATQAR